MRTDNILILEAGFEQVLKGLKEAAEGFNANIKVENTRNNMLTLFVENNGQKTYLHSKYNPVNEAEVYVNQFGEVDKYEHVIFYGIGLAYHIEAFFDKFDKPFSIYEPFHDIFNSYVSAKSLESLPLDRLEDIFIGDIQENPYEGIEELLEGIEGEVLLIMLPSYERAFKEEYKSFYQRFGSILEDKKTLKRTDRLFEKLWVANIMKNFNEIVDSPNILRLKNNVFKGKPAILVSAGPSLEYELENLRYINKNGLAYIFSVGSAINTLLEYDIHPDAALTYDPQGHNPIVFRKMYDMGITNIPLVFGTIAGYGTAQAYEGPKLHFINSKDTITPYFFKLEGGEEIDTVFDAGSIAVAALQILYKLDCDPIILVGQNLAYKDRRFYAKGINYGMGSSEIDGKHMDSSFLIDDVEGNKIHTSNVLNHYKHELERYIRYYDIKNVINTTKGGAAIDGSAYRPLQDVIKDMLVSSIVKVDWYKDNPTYYDIDYMISKCKSIADEYDKLIDIFNSIKTFTAQIAGDSRAVYDPEVLFSDFYTEFNKLISNSFFNTFIYPMNYYQCSLLNNKISNIHSEKDIVIKMKKLCRDLEPFIDGCINDTHVISPLFMEMRDTILDNEIKVMTFSINL